MSRAIIAESRTLKLRDRRLLGFTEYGDPQGRPILAFHGVPGTRLMYRPMATAAQTESVRIISLDRPGYGLSSPLAGRQLIDWPSDVAQLIQHLGLKTFSIMGISGGGPYAVATAAHFGARIDALGLISPLGPIVDLADKSPLTRLQRRFFLNLPARPRLFAWSASVANATFKLAPSLNYDIFVRTLPAADRAIMQQKAIKAQVIEDVLESLKSNGVGARDDLRIYSEKWGVDFTKIKARTILWQGLADTIVPIPAALALGKLIPDCQVIELKDEGHFWVYKASTEIMRKMRAIGPI